MLSLAGSQALADLGYVVDVSRAKPYSLQAPRAKSAVLAGRTYRDCIPEASVAVVDLQGHAVRTLGR